MLIARPTEYGTGVEIFGDYWDLKSLYYTVVSLNESSTESGLLWNFAHEIRKANDDRRETDFFEFDSELIIYRGFKLFWLQLIATVKMLRENVAFKTSSSDIQADIFRLESIVESCLKSYDEITGSEIFELVRFINIPRTDYIDLFIFQMTLNNLRAKDGESRFKQLKSDLKEFYYDSPEQKKFKEFVEREAIKLNCKIEDLNMTFDFDTIDFKW